MAVAWFQNPVLDESAPLIDRASVSREFGVTKARRHPAYVYAINRNAALMHRVAEVRLHWHAYIHGGSTLARLKQPAMIAETVCGYAFPLDPKRTRTCAVPEPEALLCGRCHGEPATFGKHGAGTKSGIKRAQAHVKLGCVVAGYPSALEREAKA